ncbi:hypothetical protein PV392_29585 [Streptomyces sp. ME03-5709C]|nr:hypothetical protein [Streptomyces sp. ME03-5709C]
MNRTVIRDLGGALRVLGEHGDRISPTTSTREELDEIAEDLFRARRFLAEADRPRPTTNCPEHPHGPVEPETDGECLLCGIRRARGNAPITPPHIVLAAYDKHGGDEAVRRFGPAAVAQALATAGRGSHQYLPHPRPHSDTREETTG